MSIRCEVIGVRDLERALRERLGDLAKSNKTLNVGFFDKAKYPSGEGVPSVAFWNEFGTAKIPMRPFMRNAIRKDKDKWVAFFKAEARNSFDLERVYGRVGEVMRGSVVNAITEMSSPPNAAYTIEKKGSSHPLIDTGFMRQSVSFEIVGG